MWLKFNLMMVSRVMVHAVLLEPNLLLSQERGVRVAVEPSPDGIARVMITNCLGMSQKAEMGLEVGTATPTEVIGPPRLDCASS